MPFTLATWNINSVRLREPIVPKLLQEEGPDVLCLQECKSPVEKIPTEGFAALGYTHLIARGQKGYNGAIKDVWKNQQMCIYSVLDPVSKFR